MRTLMVGLVMVLATGPVSSGQSGSAPRPQPLLENGELMTLVIRPAYAELQAAMAKPPVSRREWADIFQKAARLAEFENLLLFRAHERTATPDWQRLSAGARDASAAVVDAALKALASDQAQDFDALRAKYLGIASACNACHQAFGRREAPIVRP